MCNKLYKIVSIKIVYELDGLKCDKLTVWNNIQTISTYKQDSII